MLLMEVLKCWKIVGFPKISIKMKDFKIFYGAQTLIYKIIQPPPPPPPDKTSHVSGTKFFLQSYTGI